MAACTAPYICFIVLHLWMNISVNASHEVCYMFLILILNNCAEDDIDLMGVLMYVFVCSVTYRVISMRTLMRDRPP